MKLVILSDSHGQHAKLNLPEGDILIHCGDISPGRGNLNHFLDFNLWLSKIKNNYKKILLVPGNHDFQIENSPDVFRKMLAENNCMLMINDWIEIDGISFFGSPFQPEFHNWAFNCPRGGIELKNTFSIVPDDVDVLITHSPPHGILDECPDYTNPSVNVNVGCEVLAEEIKRLKNLKISCFGHIHEGYGVLGKDGVMYVNASVLDRNYKMANLPVEVHICGK